MEEAARNVAAKPRLTCGQMYSGLDGRFTAKVANNRPHHRHPHHRHHRVRSHCDSSVALKGRSMQWTSRSSMQLAGWLPHGPQNVCRSMQCYGQGIYVTVPISLKFPFCCDCEERLCSSRLRAKIILWHAKRMKRLRILFAKSKVLSIPVIVLRLREFLAADIGEWPLLTETRFTTIEQDALLQWLNP